MIGLYEILNIKDGKRYVGSSCNIHRRFNDHKWLLRLSKHTNSKLQRAWNKHGEDCFVFNVVVELERVQLESEEQKLLDIVFKRKGMYYNLAIDSKAPTRGRKASKAERDKRIKFQSTKEWKEKQSVALKKYFENPDARKKASDVAKVLWLDPIHKKNVMEAVAATSMNPKIREKRRLMNLGKIKSENSKKKLSETLKEKFSDPIFKKKHADIVASEIVRINMSEGGKKRWASAENRAEQSERTKAWFSNPENRKAASLRQLEYLKNKSISYTASL